MESECSSRSTASAFFIKSFRLRFLVVLTLLLWLIIERIQAEPVEGKRKFIYLGDGKLFPLDLSLCRTIMSTGVEEKLSDKYKDKIVD
uniref:Uncharacterized protein n=1 Tax=Quercus lobata TaxID=97700 RepID=A0A7N2LB94_QUELO